MTHCFSFAGLCALLLALSSTLAQAQGVSTPAATARMQIIHNVVGPTVDIWAGSTKLADDLAFQSATALSVPLGPRIASAPLCARSGIDTRQSTGLHPL